MKLLLIGPQASGKGTQADLIAKRLNVPHFSTGAMLREEAKKGTGLGQEIATYIDQGNLVPDKIMWEMVHRHIKHHDGWVLDGYPRTLPQAHTIDKHYPPEKVVLLEVDDAICIERIAGRRICSACGKDYHIKYKPSKQDGVCDIDGGELIHRSDDHEEAVRHRLDIYHQHTEPILQHYGSRLIRIDGDQGIEEVWRDIQKKLHGDEK